MKMGVHGQPARLWVFSNLSLIASILVVAFWLCAARDGRAEEFKECERLDDLQARAANHDVDAQRTLGFWAREGICMPKDRAKAIRFFEPISSKDPYLAQALAEVYLDPKHPPAADVKRALDLLNENARNGYAPSQTLLGSVYAEGVLVDKNLPKAYELFVQAADKNPTAKYNLAEMYNDGAVVKRDPSKALSLAKEAEEAGAVSAMSGLCSAYYRGDAFGVASDLRVAYPYCYKAASYGDLPSMNRLGSIYIKAGNKASNNQKAVKWLRRSAEAGQREAQYVLGMLLLKGLLDGIPANPKEGIRYLKQAAAQGHEEAKKVLEESQAR